MGKEYPGGEKRLVNSQPSFRAQDIEEVGDNRHTTFFEMLGNWSLGDYFKKEQIPWFWEFITRELNLPKDKIYVSVYEGNDQVEKDNETYEIWKSLGVAEDHIYFYGDKKNWWSRSGTPDQMPDGEIGGPDSEVFFEFSDVKHDKKFGEKCHPNCDCGRFLEIGNSVFMQYVKRGGKLVPLPKQNVDFGGGLERLTAATNNDPDVFKIDLIWPIIEEIEKTTGKSYEKNPAPMRVIADHVRAGTFLIKNGVIPSNKLQGYVLRRLLRRAAVKMRVLKGEVSGRDFEKLVDSEVRDVVKEEISKFAKTLENGVKQVGKVEAFNLYQTYGFPRDVIEEIYKEKGMEFDREKFDNEVAKHQELSRQGSAEKFKIKK
jgi:alanyl-tRNA synthetase